MTRDYKSHPWNYGAPKTGDPWSWQPANAGDPDPLFATLTPNPTTRTVSRKATR